MTPSEILRKYGVAPNRRRGQNFLIDQNVVKKIARAAEVTTNDTVIEVGAGAGFLTRELAGIAGNVVAVEIDKKLVEILHSELDGVENIRIIQNDIFDVSIKDLDSSSQLPASGYSIVANIPYNITSRFFRFFLERDDRPTKMTVLIQREVAERICAKPPHSSILALSVQFYAEPKILFSVGPKCFFPPPKVESAVLQLGVKPKKVLAAQGDEKMFFNIIKAGFRAKRKYCISNLSKGLGVEKDRLREVFQALEIPETARAEEISLPQWLKVSSEFKVLSSKF